MKRVFGFLTVVALVAAFGVSAALADASGSFSANIATSACTINNSTGALNNNTITSLTAALQVPSGNGTTIDIRPAFVTGLYTNTQISKNNTTNITSSSALAAVTVSVEDCPAGVAFGGSPACYRVPPDTGSGVIYDERFQQISSNVFNLISACATTTTAPGCFFDLILSTLAAHSMDFVDTGNPAGSGLTNGTHQLDVNIAMTCFVNGAPVACTAAFTPNTAGACDGPGVLTVQQVKNFSNDGTICISSTGTC